MGNATKQKIAIISPYLDILGGGERFLLTVAEYFSKENLVTIFWDNDNLKYEAKKKLEVDIDKVKIEKLPSGSINLFKKLSYFDGLFYMTDGSLFFPPCSNSYLIIQSPGAYIPKRTFLNLIKLSKFKSIICYSHFVRDIIKSKLNKNVVVIPPPVLTDKFKPANKEKLIISVGRFFRWPHNKKQDILIDAYKQLHKLSEFKDWRFVLIGSVDKGEQDYLEEIKLKAKGLPIEIIPNIDFTLLTKFYGKAMIYWHAAGFEENLIKYPERAEHFGMTTIEAMSAGCIPLVFNGGGQKEIVKEGKNGFLWNTLPELINKTRQIFIKKDQYLKLFEQVQIDSRAYSKEEFIRKIKTLINRNDQ